MTTLMRSIDLNARIRRIMCFSVFVVLLYGDFIFFVNTFDTIIDYSLICDCVIRLNKGIKIRSYMCSYEALQLHEMIIYALINVEP